MPVTQPPDFNALVNKPTTVAGYGIADMGSQTVSSAAKLTTDSGSAPSTSCRAYVCFDGSGNIQKAMNVSSISRTAVGTYTVNFTTALPDANYQALLNGNTMTGGSPGIWMENMDSPGRTTSSLKIYALRSTWATIDAGRTNLAIIG